MARTDVTDRTGGGDPLITLRLLWRVESEQPSRPGPRRGLTLDAVVDTAVEVADAEGLDALTMRRLADAVGRRPMSLYTYVPGRAELLDLMVDRVYAAMPRPPYEEGDWRSRVRQVALTNRRLLTDHPWLIEVSTLRPPLGPGQLAKYDHELSAFTPAGWDDVTTDAALTHLLGFVRSTARDRLDAETTRARTGDDRAWWARVGPLLTEVVEPGRYPVADRIGTAAGAAQGGAHDPDHAWTFGLERILASFDLLISRDRPHAG